MPQLPGAAVLHGLLVLLVLWLLVAPLLLVGCCGSSYLVDASPEAPSSLRRCDGVLPHVPISGCTPVPFTGLWIQFRGC